MLWDTVNWIHIISYWFFYHFHVAYKLFQKLGETKAFKELGARLIKMEHPYCNHLEYGTDPYLECIVRHDTKTVFHHSGTCKMGAPDDKTAVVDPQLR